MSKLAYHADHFKSGSIKGLALHNFEKRGEFDKHSNQDIDPSRSYLNVQLIEQNESLYKAFKRDIQERCKGRVTSASNWLTETIVYPPDDILDDREKCLAYFRDVLSWHQEEFGEENVKSSVAHFDETTPHLHTDLIPMTSDGRLSSKDIFTRKNLNRHHTELAKFLQERGWNIQRGDSTKGKQVRAKTVPEFKAEAEREKIKIIGELCQAIEEKHAIEDWMEQIPDWPSYEAAASDAWKLIDSFKKLLETSFSSRWIFRNKFMEKSLLEAVSALRDGLMSSISALRGYEARVHLQDEHQRSKLLLRGLDEMVASAERIVTSKERLPNHKDHDWER